MIEQNYGYEADMMTVSLRWYACNCKYVWSIFNCRRHGPANIPHNPQGSQAGNVFCPSYPVHDISKVAFFTKIVCQA